MKNRTRLIVTMILVALLFCAAMASCAFADEKIYTSPTFRLPADRIMEWAENQPEGLPEEEKPEEETPAEDTDGDPDEEESRDEDEEDARVVGEAGEAGRSVTIRSSQGEVVTEGEIIYLTSKLKGFDGLDISYQWQVDRGDGKGWVDVEGANRSKHMFVADRDTITYCWRLIVNVMGEE